MASPDAQSTRNLLMGAFKKPWQKPPSVRKLSDERAQGLLKTPIGRDFTLITASGVLFKIHSVMVIGGPKVLQDGIFPGGATQEHPPAVVNLPVHHHPILVDRFVTFLYTSDYQFDPSNRGDELKEDNFEFLNATHVPTEDSAKKAVTALVVHLFMYALAEELVYPALKASAYDALVHLFVVRRCLPTSTLKEAVEATFAPLDDAARICTDEGGALQKLVVASVIAHEARNWDHKRFQGFTDALQGPGYAGFWAAYNIVKQENDDLIEQGKAYKEWAVKRAKAVEERRGARQVKEGALPSSTQPVGSSMQTGGIAKTRREKKLEKRAKAKGANAENGSDVDMEL